MDICCRKIGSTFLHQFFYTILLHQFFLHQFFYTILLHQFFLHQFFYTILLHQFFYTNFLHHFITLIYPFLQQFLQQFFTPNLFAPICLHQFLVFFPKNRFLNFKIWCKTSKIFGVQKNWRKQN